MQLTSRFHNLFETTDRAGDEAGFTLIESLIVLALLSIVMVALAVPLQSAQNAQIRDANYAFAQQQAQGGLDLIISQVRQAWEILSDGPNEVEMNVNLGGQALHVMFECDIPQPGSSVYHECVRVQSAAGTSLPSLATGTVVVDDLTNGTVSEPVFSFAPDPISPYYMTATIAVSSSDGVAGNSVVSELTHSIVFTDGALMRNLNVGN